MVALTPSHTACPTLKSGSTHVLGQVSGPVTAILVVQPVPLLDVTVISVPKAIPVIILFTVSTVPEVAVIVVPFEVNVISYVPEVPSQEGVPVVSTGSSQTGHVAAGTTITVSVHPGKAAVRVTSLPEGMPVTILFTVSTVPKSAVIVAPEIAV